MLADIAPMNAMTPIGEDTLFSELPTPQPIGTLSANIGSVAWPTWKPGTPGTPGTIMGPLGPTVPAFGANTTVPSVTGGAVTSAVVSGQSNIDAGPAVESPASTAATMDQANATGLPLGPISFLSPMPSMMQPAGRVAPVAPPDFWCSVGKWATANPVLALLSAAGLFIVLKGKPK